VRKVWIVNCHVERSRYLDFLNGMAKAQLHPVLANKLELLKPNQLITVLIDVPVMQKEEEMMLQSLGHAERMGVNILRRKAKRTENSRRDQAEVLSRVTMGTVHLLTAEQRKDMTTQHWSLIMYGCWFGFCSSVCAALAENLATKFWHTNGLQDPDTGEPSTPDQITSFGVVVLGVLLVCSIIEIMMLYIYAIKHAMQTALGAGLTLIRE
jgi:hypothetical protein